MHCAGTAFESTSFGIIRRQMIDSLQTAVASPLSRTTGGSSPRALQPQPSPARIAPRRTTSYIHGGSPGLRRLSLQQSARDASSLDIDRAGVMQSHRERGRWGELLRRSPGGHSEPRVGLRSAHDKNDPTEEIARGARHIEDSSSDGGKDVSSPKQSTERHSVDKHLVSADSRMSGLSAGGTGAFNADVMKLCEAVMQDEGADVGARRQAAQVLQSLQGRGSSSRNVSGDM